MANIDLSQQICTLEFQLDKLDKELERCRTNTRPVPDSYSDYYTSLLNKLSLLRVKQEMKISEETIK